MSKPLKQVDHEYKDLPAEYKRKNLGLARKLAYAKENTANSLSGLYHLYKPNNWNIVDENIWLEGFKNTPYKDFFHPGFVSTCL